MGGSRDIEFGVLDGTVTFAGKNYENPNLAFIDPSPGAGNIGGRVLMDFIMTIDQQNGLVRFDELAAEKSVSRGDTPRQVGMMFRDMSGGGAMTLATVMPNSLAAKAGLEPGDVMIAINDEPLAFNIQ